MIQILPDNSLAWGCLAISAIAVALYELRFRQLMRRRPGRAARLAHGKVRAAWVEAIASHPGSEILAVQTIRNSLMTATIIGSTAALALMGTASLTVSGMNATLLDAHSMFLHPSPRNVLFAALVCSLFAILIFSVMAMRFFNHTGYLLTGLMLSERPTESQRRAVQRYIVMAGVFQSMSMRTLLWLAPIAAGLFSPFLLPPTVFALLWILRWFDRTPEVLAQE